MSQLVENRRRIYRVKPNWLEIAEEFTFKKLVGDETQQVFEVFALFPAGVRWKCPLTENWNYVNTKKLNFRTFVSRKNITLAVITVSRVFCIELVAVFSGRKSPPCLVISNLVIVTCI